MIDEHVAKLTELKDKIQEGRFDLSGVIQIMEDAAHLAAMVPADSINSVITGSVIGNLRHVHTLCLGMEDAITYMIEAAQA